MEPVILQGSPPDWVNDYGGGGGIGGYGRGGGDYGSGYGYGSGDKGGGYGYGGYGGGGYGSGYGRGDGGYGDGGGGYGDGGGGYGCGEYWSKVILSFAEQWTDAQQGRLKTLQKEGATIAYWRSCKNGKAANGGRNNPVAPGLVETTQGPLRNSCGEGQLHATLNPPQWKGERWWIVALIGEVRGDEEKYWALKREIIGECL